MKNKKIEIIDLGDLTGKSYCYDGFTFTFSSIVVVLNYIKVRYYQFDLVDFDFQGSHYKLEIKYRLTTQKTIEL